MCVKLWSLMLEGWNFECGFFLSFQNLFFLLSAEIARKLAESASAYHGRARRSPQTWNKNGSKLKKNVTWTRKSTFELIILEHFDCFTSLRVAGCLSAALKRQPNEAGNKYSELYTYFKLNVNYENPLNFFFLIVTHKILYNLCTNFVNLGRTFFLNCIFVFWTFFLRHPNEKIFFKFF